VLHRRASRRRDVNAVTTAAACVIRVRGVVQGVGFRPFVYRLARSHGLSGWVRNDASGVQLHVEGAPDALVAFARALVADAPAAATIAAVESAPAGLEECDGFEIRTSKQAHAPATARIAPDMAVCDACLRELFDPGDRRYRYPYITCTDCGPRYSIVTGLPYDRPLTTMHAWPMCAACERDYNDPANRRFHAQPLACSACGPTYELRTDAHTAPRGWDAVAAAAALLRGGAIVAVKGIGGYHLACDAANATAVEELRARKFRKERPFAVMVRDLTSARALIELSPQAEQLLTSVARPVVIAAARVSLAGVAPDNSDVGVMLPYTPLHHLLFAAEAPATIVLTSANRSSEPMAFDEGDAYRMLDGLADAFLVGERGIARRLDDSVARITSYGASIVRRARGMAPQAVASLPATQPIVAVGGDLKNAPLLVVDGQAFAGAYVGDLEHLACRDALAAGVRDLCAMYRVRERDLIVAYDAHPEYASTAFAKTLGGLGVAVQHHRAHIASVIAEREAWDTDVLGAAFDGTGYGDDGTIWGGEFFSGSLRRGLGRVAHLRAAALPGGDAAARFPVQAAAGFLYELRDLPDLTCAPFAFPPRYLLAREMVAKGVRTFRTTSVGRLLDAVAALVGFVREVTFEGQAAMWLEQQATSSGACGPYVLPLREAELDYRPLLRAVIADRLRGCDPGAIARAVHLALVDAIVAVHDQFGNQRPLVASGGVFQNRLLTDALHERLGDRLWLNRAVPPNDGGLALGQAALAAFAVSAPDY
jgi:hydrogenase maturation protein HypF